MNANEAKAKSTAIGKKYPDMTRKVWEVRKEFAKECGINIKVFNKGLGAQYQRLIAEIKGAKEIDAYVPIDQRQMKSLIAEQQKLARIIADYQKIIIPKLTPIKHEPEWYGWDALNEGLKELERWAREGVQRSADNLKARADQAARAQRQQGKR